LLLVGGKHNRREVKSWKQNWCPSSSWYTHCMYKRTSKRVFLEVENRGPTGNDANWCQILELASMRHLVWHNLSGFQGLVSKVRLFRATVVPLRLAYRWYGMPTNYVMPVQYKYNQGIPPKVHVANPVGSLAGSLLAKRCKPCNTHK
jgi:hypothetical protein